MLDTKIITSKITQQGRIRCSGLYINTYGASNINVAYFDNGGDIAVRYHMWQYCNKW
jgi:hypothetical protein